MNVFVIGVGGDPAGPERALRALLDRLPFFPGRPVETWRAPSGRAAAAWVAHGPEYAAAERDRLALFAGRPIRWLDEREADGRGAIEARAYLDGIPDGLDGRFAVVRYYDATGRLEAVTDELGAYPLYETRAGGARFVSNSPEPLRLIAGSGEFDPGVLAAVVGGGWSLDGHPLWSGVRRIAAAGAAVRPGAGFDPDRAATLLAASLRALADWPGRPSVVPVTGGRDSRVVLGAAMHGGIDFTTTTGGGASSPDVRIGRRLAAVAGAPHAPIEGEHMWDDWRRGGAILTALSGGTATLGDAAGFPLGPRAGPLPLWHSGQGGEVARAYYGSGARLDRRAAVELLVRRFLGRRPGRPGVLNDDARAAVEQRIGAWVDAKLGAGAAIEDVPDLFYLERRMGTWAGPTHGAVEPVRDTTSPLWSPRLLPDLLGMPPADRAAGRFHREVLERLAPELVGVPYEDAGRGGRVRRRARQVAAEIRRRTGGRRAADPFDATLGEIRDLVLAQPQHAAWQVLDRARVESLLSNGAGALDEMSRYYAWRLATVFAATPRPGRGASCSP